MAVLGLYLVLLPRTMFILFQDKRLFSSILQHKEASEMDIKIADNR